MNTKLFALFVNGDFVQAKPFRWANIKDDPKCPKKDFGVRLKATDHFHIAEILHPQVLRTVITSDREKNVNLFDFPLNM